MNISMMPNFNSYVTFLYQMNGRLYTEDEKNRALDTKTALHAFNYFMRFYKDYKSASDFRAGNKRKMGNDHDSRL